jgi:predicted amidohydrolase
MISSSIVAAVQFKPDLLNVEKNLGVALQMTFEAAAKGAKIIVLPELCTSGHVIRNIDEATSACQEKDGYQTQAFLPIARKFGCYIVFGYPEYADGNLYNSAAVIGPNGLEGNCQKHNLWGPDNMWAQPSESIHPVINTPMGRLGILICRDVGNNYRESYRFHKSDHKFYKRGSVDTIALLTNWGEGFGYPDSSWVELCEQTGSNVIVSNRIGKERDLKFKGGSCVIDRNRKIWTHGSSFTEAAVVGGIVVL